MHTVRNLSECDDITCIVTCVGPRLVRRVSCLILWAGIAIAQIIQVWMISFSLQPAGQTKVFLSLTLDKYFHPDRKYGGFGPD